MWMGSVTDSWKSSHRKLKSKRICQIKFSCVTLQPKLELLCGPPTQCGSSPRDPQSFRLLPLAVSAGGDPPSPDGRGTCLWNAEVAHQGRNITLIYVEVHSYENVQQPNVKYAGASFATVFIPGTRFKLQLQKPC